METDNANAKVCQTLLDDALAGCVVSRTGKVGFFYGDDGLFTTNPTDAAMILATIAQLLARRNAEENKESQD